MLLISGLNANLLRGLDVQSYGPYLANFMFELTGLVGAIWYFRVRGGQPMTPLERQLGQVWLILMMTVVLTIMLNVLMGFRPYYLGGLDPCVWGLGCSLAAGIVVSLATAAPDPRRVSALFDAEATLS